MSHEKIGIFGGSFNPVHVGHLNSLRTVIAKNKLIKIFVIPNAQNPLKEGEVDTPTAEDRIQMLKLALQDEKNVTIDDQEIKRGGKSYSFETIRHYSSKYGAENIYFIMGADSFLELDQWKFFEEILKETNLIVTTRPGAELPFEKEDFPLGIQPFIKAIEANGVIKLKTGRQIIYTQLEDLNISATHLRKRLRLSKNVDQFLTYEVEQYIREKGLYAPLKIKIPDFESFTKQCAQVLFNKKAIRLKAIDLRKLSAPSEFAIICSGTSTKQTLSLAESVISWVKEEYGVLPISVEGASEGRWVLVDFGSLIIHIFYDFVRQEYRLEDLWKEGCDLNLQDQEAPDKTK